LSEIFGLLVQLETSHIKFAGKVVDHRMTSSGMDALVSLKSESEVGNQLRHSGPKADLNCKP